MERKTDKVKLTIFLIVTSFVFYITSVITSIIDPSFTLSNDFCTHWETIEVGEDESGNIQTEDICMSFKDTLSEQMYYYNSAVVDRRYFWLIFQVLISTAVMILVAKLIYSSPEEKIELMGNMSPLQSFIILAFVVLFVGVFGSLILSWILPKPASYLPYITYQLDQWEENMINKISSGDIQINSKGEIIK